MDTAGSLVDMLPIKRKSSQGDGFSELLEARGQGELLPGGRLCATQCSTPTNSWHCCGGATSNAVSLGGSSSEEDQEEGPAVSSGCGAHHKAAKTCAASSSSGGGGSLAGLPAGADSRLPPPPHAASRPNVTTPRGAAVAAAAAVASAVPPDGLGLRSCMSSSAAGAFASCLLQEQRLQEQWRQQQQQQGLGPLLPALHDRATEAAGRQEEASSLAGGTGVQVGLGPRSAAVAQVLLSAQQQQHFHQQQLQQQQQNGGPEQEGAGSRSSAAAAAREAGGGACWPDLPDDILARVLALLPASHLRVLRLVCSGWERSVARAVRGLRPEALAGKRLAARFPSVHSLDLSHCELAVDFRTPSSLKLQVRTRGGAAAAPGVPPASCVGAGCASGGTGCLPCRPSFAPSDLLLSLQCMLLLLLRALACVPPGISLARELFARELFLLSS